MAGQPGFGRFCVASMGCPRRIQRCPGAEHHCLFPCLWVTAQAPKLRAPCSQRSAWERGGGSFFPCQLGMVALGGAQKNPGTLEPSSARGRSPGTAQTCTRPRPGVLPLQTEGEQSPRAPAPSHRETSTALLSSWPGADTLSSLVSVPSLSQCSRESGRKCMTSSDPPERPGCCRP